MYNTLSMWIQTVGTPYSTALASAMKIEMLKGQQWKYIVKRNTVKNCIFYIEKICSLYFRQAAKKMT